MTVHRREEANPPGIGLGLALRAYDLAPEAGRAIWHQGALLTFKAVGDDTGGRCWVMEHVAPHDFRSPLHVHTREDEAWYVVEGAISFFIGDGTVRAPAGSFLFGPRGTPHGFRVETATAKLVVFATPAGLERFFFETGGPAEALTVPPPGHDVAPVADVAAGLERYGVALVEPPPGGPRRPVDHERRT